MLLLEFILGILYDYNLISRMLIEFSTLTYLFKKSNKRKYDFRYFIP